MEQECQRCHTLLSLEMFAHYRTICNACVEQERARDTKACAECGVVKPKSAFPINKAAVDGRRKVCLECVSRQKTAQRAAAPRQYTLAQCLEIVHQTYGPDVLLESDYGRRTLQREMFQIRQHVPFTLNKRAALEHDVRNSADDLTVPETGVATIWEWNKEGRRPKYRIYLPAVPVEEVIEARTRRREWARTLLESPDSWAILDTETTGLEEDRDITDIALIDTAGKPLYTSLVRPTKLIPPEVVQKTRISNSMVSRAPEFATIYVRLRPLLNTRSLLIYNAEFDLHTLKRQIREHCGEDWAPVQAECLMLAYAEYVGERHGPGTRFAGEYRHHKLEAACAQMRIEVSQTHRALPDCHQTLALLRAMAT